MNTLSFQLFSELKEMYVMVCYSNHSNLTKIENVTAQNISEIESIYFFSTASKNFSEIEPIGVTVKLPKKKQVSINWFQDKINFVNVYTNFSEKFAKLVDRNGVSIYPTSYGIGIFIAVGTLKMKEAMINEVNEVMKKYDINYKNEISEGGWVLRYKISKTKDNLSKLDNR